MAARQSRQPRQPRQAKEPVAQQSSVTARTDKSSESGELLTPDELARALRAVAAELERDPALARRVAGAMRLSTSDALPPASVPVENTAADASGTLDGATRHSAPKRFRPRLVTGAAPSLGPGVPDPFALREQLGEDGLRAVLDDLRLGTLRAIVREHRLDPAGQLAGQNDDAKFRALIMRATKRPQRGSPRP